MQKKPCIGFIHYKTYPDIVDDVLVKKMEKKMEVIKIPFEEQLDLDEINKKTKNCRIIFNSSTYEPVILESLELSKTLEAQGKRVINSSRSFFYQEDKWMFYLKCMENNLPTPKTFLISRHYKFYGKQIKTLLKKHPLVLKGVFSNQGNCVEKVDSYNQFLRKIKKIREKYPSSPIIAQEFIPNNNSSYRVTLINNKVEQAVIKINGSWKQTGDETDESFRRINLDPEIKRMCEKASKALEMELCGLDLINNNGKWYLIEANSCPAMDFIEKDMPRLNQIFADYLYGLARKGQ